MFNECKYVIFDGGSGADFAVCFPNCVKHEEIAQKMQRKVLGAGFYSLYIENNEIKVKTFGKSVGLGIESKPEDANMVRFAVIRIY